MRKRNVLPLLSLLAVFFAFGTLQTWACTCAGPRSFGGKNFQPCGVFWRAEAVFIGKVENISFEKSQIGGKEYYNRMIASFSVEKAVRGVTEKTVEIQTSPSTASCGYPFKEGERYFVYVNRGRDGKFAEYLCGATVLLKNAQADLEYLRTVESGEKGGRVFGNVQQHVQPSSSGRQSYEGLGGITVRLNSVKVKDGEKSHQRKYVKRTFETKTNEDGFYLLTEVPEGTYTIEADLPTHLRPLYRNAKPPFYVSIDLGRNIHCGAANFLSTSLSSIEGRVFQVDGRAPPQQYIWLMSVDEAGNEEKVAFRQTSWINAQTGMYRFETVPPGRYVLAVNPKNCHTREAPQFGSTFFPDSVDIIGAEHLIVSNSQRITVRDFRLPPTLKPRLFSGVVLSADNKPGSGVRVMMLNDERRGCQGFSSQQETKTDELGRFELAGYEGYRYKIRAYLETKSVTSGRLHSDWLLLPVSTGNLSDIHLILKNSY